MLQHKKDLPLELVLVAVKYLEFDQISRWYNIIMVYLHPHTIQEKKIRSVPLTSSANDSSQSTTNINTFINYLYWEVGSHVVLLYKMLT